MDVSGSVGVHWKDEKNFVKKLAQAIRMSPEGGHAAVTIFSSKSSNHEAAELMIKFNDHKTFPDFEKAVDALPYWRGTTYIDQGLDVARNEMFRESNGMRPTAPKTLVLITDGIQTGKKIDFSSYKTFFHNEQIRVIVIGIGSNLNKQDLLKLVDVESDLHVAADFDELLKDSFIKGVTLCGMLLYII